MEKIPENIQENPSVLNEEVDFSFDELFFSRTNESGIILSGNSVFQRISNYAWNEILSKPHKLIRHNDMPRAVFWLLWETIKNGQPIGAYVKNRAKDGRYYWVFAIVTPVEGGFLSVRLKPSSALFEAAKGEYAALRAMEINDNLKPAEGAAILLSRLQELGFRDYAAFMSAAISQEMVARDIQTDRQEDNCIACFNRLVSSAQCLQDHATKIFSAYEGNAYVPLNMTIQASHLGNFGAPMCVISSNYTSISEEIQENLKCFLESGTKVARVIDEGLFLLATSRIQREVFDHFQQDTPNDGASRDQEMEFLDQQQQSYSEKAAQGLDAISLQIRQFQQACLAMRKLTSILEVTRVMGKIESASLDASRTSLNDLIDDLGSFQKAILDGLKEIDESNKAIRFDIEQLLKAS